MTNRTKQTLQQMIDLHEETKKSWEDGEPEGTDPAIKVPGEKEPKQPPREVVVTNTETPSNWNTLVVTKKKVPGDDPDANTMQLDQDQKALHELEEALLELEAFLTPDYGMGALGRSLYTGAAVSPPNGYDRNTDPTPLAPEEIPPEDQADCLRNFDPDPRAPEQGGRVTWHDASNSLVSPQQFVPRESKGQQKEFENWAAKQLQARRQRLLGKD